MNYRAIAHYVGRVLMAEAAFMLVPMLISIYDREQGASRGFVIAVVIMFAVSLTIGLIGRGNRNITAKDGFTLVAVSWVLISVFGAFPFWFSGEFPSFLDCVFESVSGFTTTGASILTDVEALPKGLLFWRSFTQWIGGMGILVFLLAVVPAAVGEHTINVLKAESPGPAPGKLVPKLARSSKILYGIYLGLTFLQIILYLVGGMPLFDSLCNTFASAGTGGFSIWRNSIAHYDSVYVEVVTSVFTTLFGVNFNVYYFLLIRNFRAAFKNEEARVYFGIILASVAIITFNIFGTVYDSFGMSLRHASFQAVSIITTTGYVTADFEVWPELSRMLLMLLMFVGACGGSTGGGLKVSRVIIMFKETRRILFRMSHPRSFEVVKLDGKAVDKLIVHGVTAYFITFALIYAGSLLLLSINNFDFTATFTALSSCINNTGLGLGIIGPMGNYADFSAFSKLILALNMLIGRLEIYPILLLFAPHTWSKL